MDGRSPSSPTQRIENKKLSTSLDSSGVKHGDVVTSSIHTTPGQEPTPSAGYPVTITEDDPSDRLTTSEDVAANSLLSLSADEAHRRPEFGDSSIYQDDSNGAVSSARSMIASYTTTHREVDPQGSVDEQTKLKLLRHFRYEVAPWVR